MKIQNAIIQNAIKLLATQQTHSREDDLSQAIHVAIRALEALDKDHISRAAVLDMLHVEDGSTLDPVDLYNDIYAMPSVYEEVLDDE